MSERQESGRTYIYRAYDAEGRLLYIGMTNDLVQRIGQHQSSHWIWDVASITAETYPTRAEASTAECAAIRSEVPRWNVKSSPNGRQVEADLWAMNPSNPRNFGPRKPPPTIGEWIVLGRRLNRMTWPIQYHITLRPLDEAGEPIY